MDLVPGLTIGQVEGVLQGLALIAGAIAFASGLYQYSKAQAWKRHEFVAAEVRAFNADPLARNAMLMIDWGTRQIELFPSHPDYKARYVLITRPTLHGALLTHDKIARAYTTNEAAVRDCFDAFFGWLERFEHFMQAKLVKPDEFERYLAYWLRSICEEANPELRMRLNDYVAFYRFDSVSLLFERYGRSFGKPRQEPGPTDRHQIQDHYEATLNAEMSSDATEVQGPTMRKSGR